MQPHSAIAAETGLSDSSSSSIQNTSGSYSLDLSEEEKAWREQHKEILVSNEFDWPPFDFAISGEPQGFGIDLMNLLSQRSGITFHYINGYTWDELVNKFFQGEIDLLHSLSITPERQEKALFSPPYYHSKNVLILRRDTPDTNSLADLGGKTIALPKGWSSIQFFQKNFPAVHIAEVESSRQALEYVDQGKAFASVEQEGIAAYFIKKFGFHDLKLSTWIENDELQITSSMHFAVLKDKPHLFSILFKALKTIQPEDMTRLEQKWFSREGRQIGSNDLGLTPEERAYLERRKTITYCISPDAMPFESYQDDHLAGMTSDFLEMFSERTGAQFTLVPTSSWTESLEQIKQKNCDILPMVNETPARQKYIDFTSPYLNYGIAIISREKEGFIGGLQDLDGKRLAVPQAAFFSEILSQKYPEISMVVLDDVRQCLLHLSSGDVDFALLSLPVATYHIRHMGLNNLKVAGYAGIEDVIRIGVRNDDTLLHSIMSKLVRSLHIKDIDSVYQKWVSLTFEHRFDYSLMWKILGAIGLLLTIIVLWNWQLMRLNRKLAAAHNELKTKSKELEKISTTDALTGLFNRRYIQAKLQEEILRHQRYKRNISIILIDLDNFKNVNDTFGHQTGDMVLRKFAELLTRGTRDSDVAGRWGGEEFLIICPETDVHGAMIQAEHLREKFAAITFAELGRQTASFGVAVYYPGESMDNLIRRADDALYLAKNNGRNRIKAASSK